jgi:hypothetical protein
MPVETAPEWDICPRCALRELDEAAATQDVDEAYQLWLADVDARLPLPEPDDVEAEAEAYREVTEDCPF